MKRDDCLRWTLGVCLAAGLTGVPFTYYRYDYTRNKRLREVVAPTLVPTKLVMTLLFEVLPTIAMPLAPLEEMVL